MGWEDNDNPFRLYQPLIWPIIHLFSPTLTLRDINTLTVDATLIKCARRKHCPARCSAKHWRRKISFNSFFNIEFKSFLSFHFMRDNKLKIVFTSSSRFPKIIVDKRQIIVNKQHNAPKSLTTFEISNVHRFTIGRLESAEFLRSFHEIFTINFSITFKSVLVSFLVQKHTKWKRPRVKKRRR